MTTSESVAAPLRPSPQDASPQSSSPPPASGQPSATPDGPREIAEDRSTATLLTIGRARDCTWPCYWHTFAQAGVGRGLRLNNPYRLQTALGSQAESLSATAPYFDARLGALSGDPHGWHHGVSVGLAWALEGVPQQVITPSYVIAYPLGVRHWLHASVGPSVVVQPDANVGLEVDAQWVVLVRAGLGAYLGLSYAAFWGAATEQSSATFIPIVGAHAGVSVHYEVLP